uniref:Lefty/antivin related protein n=1 Tax=Ciona savignyi TaxID=51511 RepID=Q95YK6_CIOSA|nr:lefty/antivin related protein [Ciona savignyi]
MIIVVFLALVITSQATNVIQDGILTHLGLGEVPRFTHNEVRNVVIPDETRRKYERMVEKMTKLERNRRSSSLQDLFRSVHKKTGIEGDVIYSDTFREELKFDMEGRLPDDYMISMAELRLFKKLPNHNRILSRLRTPSGNRNDVQLSSARGRQQVIRNARVSIHLSLPLPDGGAVTELVDSRLILVNGSGWHTFDVTSAIRKWRRHPVRYMTITLELKVQSSSPGRAAAELARLIRFTGQRVALDSPRRPELVVYTNAKEPARTSDCSSSRHNRQHKCCRENRFVNFRETKWSKHWILEPAGFNAYHCAGGCRSDRRRNSKGAPRSCSATETNSLPIMYLVKKGGAIHVEVSEFPNMVIEKCSCALDSGYEV